MIGLILDLVVRMRKDSQMIIVSNHNGSKPKSKYLIGVGYIA